MELPEPQDILVPLVKMEHLEQYTLHQHQLPFTFHHPQFPPTVKLPLYPNVKSIIISSI